MNMKRRLATLEGERKYDGLGTLLDALDDPAAMANVRISPSIVAMLKALDGDDVEQPIAVRNQDLPL